MSRRKGTPCACDCADPCGNKVRKINGISPDPNGRFTIAAGPGIGITEDQNGITIDAAAASGVLTINGQSPDSDGDFSPVIETINGQSPDANGDFSPVVQTINGQSPDADGDLSGLIEGSGNIGGDLKPIKIVNGEAIAVINELVDVATQQTIKKLKILESTISADILLALRTNKTYVSGIQYSPQIEFDADDTNEKNGVIGSERTSATNSRMFLDVHDPVTGIWKGGLYLITDGTDAWVECPRRTYNALNTNDVVTIGSLQASSDVVHRTGNETISDSKTFTETVYRQTSQINRTDTSRTSDVYINGFFLMDVNNVPFGGIEFGMGSNGNRVIRLRLSKSNGTYSYKKLFEIDNSGNVII